MPLPRKKGTPHFFESLNVKANARIWPWLSRMFHVRSTADHSRRLDLCKATFEGVAKQFAPVGKNAKGKPDKVHSRQIYTHV